jgi:GNAT superfamily N-acetyltransferase
VLWRVRTTLSDRPGSLATLTRHCGEQGVNILGLQIFPGVAGVTDELVLRAPEQWTIGDVAGLVEGAGGEQVSVSSCTEHALVDGPIQYLDALRRLAQDPGAAAGLLAELLDAELGGAASAWPAAVEDTMTVDVGHRVVLRRIAPFTATEHARAAAFAVVAAELVASAAPERADRGPAGPTPAGPLDAGVRLASLHDTPALVRMHQRCSTDSVHRRYGAPLVRIDDRFARRLLLAEGGALVATVGAEVVAVASVSLREAGVVEVAILVEDGWQRRGLGTRLLSAAARLARGQGATEVVLRSRSHNPALMSLAFASGLRARIRIDGEAVVVTFGVEGLRPLTTVPGRSLPESVAGPGATAPR